MKSNLVKLGKATKIYVYNFRVHLLYEFELGELRNASSKICVAFGENTENE